MSPAGILSEQVTEMISDLAVDLGCQELTALKMRQVVPSSYLEDMSVNWDGRQVA